MVLYGFLEVLHKLCFPGEEGSQAAVLCAAT